MQKSPWDTACYCPGRFLGIWSRSKILVTLNPASFTSWHLPVLLYSLESYSIDSPKSVGNSPAVSKFQPKFLRIVSPCKILVLLKSSRLHVHIFRFCIDSLEVFSIDSSETIGNSPYISLKLSTSNFSNSTGSSVTSCQSSPRHRWGAVFKIEVFNALQTRFGASKYYTSLKTTLQNATPTWKWRRHLKSSR